jgi:hypothetical protein
MSNRGGLVYVVDDDAGVHDAVADLIRSAGLIAETLASGDEFLTVARPNHQVAWCSPNGDCRVDDDVRGDGYASVHKVCAVSRPGVLVILVMLLGKPCAAQEIGAPAGGDVQDLWRGICARGLSRANRSYK